jgi:hypothetical protein
MVSVKLYIFFMFAVEKVFTATVYNNLNDLI